MNTKPPVRLIKNAERKKAKNRNKIESAATPNTSTAVKSWVVEFQHRDRNQSPPAFDRLFKDALPETAPTD